MRTPPPVSTSVLAAAAPRKSRSAEGEARKRPLLRTVAKLQRPRPELDDGQESDGHERGAPIEPSPAVFD
jgi:hypothetical protein